MTSQIKINDTMLGQSCNEIYRASNDHEIKILSFYYLFENIENSRNLECELDFIKKKCENLSIKGTILVSKEGLNGTISGEKNNIDAIFSELKNYFESLEQKSENDKFEYKFNSSDFIPFSKLKILLKKEVVALQNDLDCLNYNLKPENANSQKWEELLADKNVQLLDTRNDYEYKIGTFDGALNPEIKNFREFKDFLRNSVETGSLDKEKPCAIFCTGGIRCEKAGIYMKNLGFKDVFQLQGGILKYFEETKNASKKWIGDCFVFDDRVTVNDKLEAGDLRCIHCHEKISTIEEKRSVTKAKISCSSCKELKN